MLAKFVTFSAFTAAAFAAACTDDQLTAHGLAGTRQTILFSRLEDNQDGTFGVFEKRAGEGGFVCTVASGVVYPNGVPERRSNNKLFARCVGRRDDNTHYVPLAFRTDFCPCVGNTCNDGADCIDAGCPGGCGCVYETGPPGDPGGLNCGCA